jgi:hypothetical protein
MLAHYLVRRVMHGAAVVAGYDVDRVSFIDSRRVIRCQLPESPPVAKEAWHERLLREVRRQRLRPRRDRWYARVVQQKISNWGKKRVERRKSPRPTKPLPGLLFC